MDSASSPSLSAAAPSTGALFAHSDFVRYQAARSFAAVAVQIQSVAVAWQVYEVTHRALDLGLVGLSQFAPLLLLSLVSGHVADRFERRSILTLCFAAYMVCALAFFALTQMPHLGVAPIYAVLILFGIARAFAGPAAQSFLPALVPRELFSRAVALNSSTFQMAMLLGPALGGVLFAWLGARLYLLNAVMLASTVVLLASMKTRTVVQSRRESGWKQLVAGVHFVLERRIVLGAISLDLFAVLLGGAVALLPVYAADVLHVGAWGMGCLRSAPAFGAMLVGLLLAWRPLARRAGRAMFACVFVFGVATIVFGLSRNFTLSLLSLAVLGAADMVSVYVRQTLVQLATPDEMRGRVSAVNQVFIGASNELGEFESGITAAMLGAVPAVVLGGIGTCLVVLTWTALFPSLRRVDRLDEAPTPQ